MGRSSKDLSEIIARILFGLVGVAVGAASVYWGIQLWKLLPEIVRYTIMTVVSGCIGVGMIKAAFTRGPMK